jgi:hypothetical protein
MEKSENLSSINTAAIHSVDDSSIPPIQMKNSNNANALAEQPHSISQSQKDDTQMDESTLNELLSEWSVDDSLVDSDAAHSHAKRTSLSASAHFSSNLIAPFQAAHNAHTQANRYAVSSSLRHAPSATVYSRSAASLYGGTVALPPLHASATVDYKRRASAHSLQAHGKQSSKGAADALSVAHLGYAGSTRKSRRRKSRSRKKLTHTGAAAAAADETTKSFPHHSGAAFGESGSGAFGGASDSFRHAKPLHTSSSFADVYEPSHAYSMESAHAVNSSNAAAAATPSSQEAHFAAADHTFSEDVAGGGGDGGGGGTVGDDESFTHRVCLRLNQFRVVKFLRRRMRKTWWYKKSNL